MKLLKTRITQCAEKITVVLRDYQPNNVTDYEIERCIRTIDGLSNNEQYLNISIKISSTAIMLPSNLPLYSLLIFAIIPSLLSKSVYVRPNTILQEKDIVSRIFDELELEHLFPEIKIINQDHAGFEQYVQKSDLVVFTGKPSNAQSLLKKMKQDSVLVINGSGHNPVIVTDTADIDKAIEGALMLKGFNGGQDCAGPDAILVHHSVSQQFIEKFQAAYTRLKQGKFTEPDTIIGPIHRFTELQRLAGLIHQNKNDVIAGGSIDYRNSIVEPTVIVRGIERYPNYQEIYGPLTFIHPYKEDQDLALYFERDGHYTGNRMYVTVYGHSEYAAARNDAVNPGAVGNIGIVLQNETIHEVEIGYKAYGGYSMGASGLIKQGGEMKIQQAAMPILLPQVIVDYIINDKKLPQIKCKALIHTPSASSRANENPMQSIIIDFQSLIKKLFINKLAFAFVFGSAAKGNLKTSKDDLDTFVCLNEEQEDAKTAYLEELKNLHYKHQLIVDQEFPAEVMTLTQLQQAIDYSKNLNVSIHETICGEKFDNLFWVHTLSDKKIGFMGDGRLMSSLIKPSQQHVTRWSTQIIQQITETPKIPEHLQRTFSGLNKEQILDKLSQYSPHLIVHLGLNYSKNPEATPSALTNPQVRFFPPLMAQSSQHPAPPAIAEKVSYGAK